MFTVSRKEAEKHVDAVGEYYRLTLTQFCDPQNETTPPLPLHTELNIDSDQFNQNGECLSVYFISFTEEKPEK